ncbi:hypothetical protein [Pedobacter antarcticus]|uniref:hypothetical protein n=1 Tax=Pedobacter antarcticus TaxID=34086 RepID=UPI00292D34B0|nr:hypothetical protein [Pedobacter antarcticus]
MKRGLLYILLAVIFAGCQNPPEKKRVLVMNAKRYFPNTLANKIFVTDRLFAFVSDTSDYSLKLSDTIRSVFTGNVLKFTDTIHFVSSFHTWCGNDRFDTVYGRYYFTDSLKISFYTDSITRFGECSTVTEHTKSRPALNLYLVKDDKGHLELIHGPAVI